MLENFALSSNISEQPFHDSWKMNVVLILNFEMEDFIIICRSIGCLYQTWGCFQNVVVMFKGKITLIFKKIDFSKLLAWIQARKEGVAWDTNYQWPALPFGVATARKKRHFLSKFWIKKLTNNKIQKTDFARMSLWASDRVYVCVCGGRSPTRGTHQNLE